MVQPRVLGCQPFIENFVLGFFLNNKDSHMESQAIELTKKLHIFILEEGRGIKITS
jgi:hypothetical protein